jgi:hypothetical protein
MQFHGAVGQQTTGMAFSFNATTEEEFVDLKWLLQNLEPHDVLSAVQNHWALKPMTYTNISVSYNPDLSTAKAVKITAAYGKISIYCQSQFL